MKPKTENTLVIIKPDALQRGLTGEIVQRFEHVGLKLVACKMMRPTRQLVEKHYTDDKEYLLNLGNKTIKVFEEYQYDVKEVLGTDDPYELGVDIREKLIKYMITAPCIVLVWQGVQAVSVVRKMIGSTAPLLADVGTIRGDFSHVSSLSAPLKGNPIMNLVHASGTLDEAKNEIVLWFGKSFKPKEYTRIDEFFF